MFADTTVSTFSIRIEVRASSQSPGWDPRLEFGRAKPGFFFLCSGRGTRCGTGR